MTGSSKPRRRSQTRKRARRTPASDPPHGFPASTAPAAAGPIDAANLDEAFVKALEADFIAHGAKAIAADPLREMTDAELDRHIEELARRAGFEIRAAVGVGREDATRDEGADAD